MRYLQFAARVAWDVFATRKFAMLAAKRRDSSAQGNALGMRWATNMLALKGRDRCFNRYRSHPVGVQGYDIHTTQGVALG